MGEKGERAEDINYMEKLLTNGLQLQRKQRKSPQEEIVLFCPIDFGIRQTKVSVVL